jgi:hypothetical protein
MNLLELQRRMASDVTRPLTAEFAMQPDTVAADYIKPNDRLSSFERLEIYNRQYWFRTIGAVSEDYSALRAVVGSARFDTLVLAYLRENPSTSFTLRDLGGRLPDWLGQHPEYAGRRYRLALDVARLEWAYVEAYDGRSLPPMDEGDFAGLSGESRLALQPHLRLLALEYPVDELVLAVHEANPAADIASNAVTGRRTEESAKLPSMRRSATYLAVHRFDDTVFYRRLDREAYLLLSGLAERRTLGEALEAAFSGSRMRPEAQARKIQEYFAHAAQLGWVCREIGE